MHIKFPNQHELAKADSQERMNIFRRYFAASRYNRIIIQQYLIRSALDESLAFKVTELENDHNKSFFDTIRKVKTFGYLDEFLIAVNEEDEALGKIIDAYEKRMNRFPK